MTDVAIPITTMAAAFPAEGTPSVLPPAPQGGVASASPSPFAALLVGLAPLSASPAAQPLGAAPTALQELAEHGKILPESVSSATVLQQALVGAPEPDALRLGAKIAAAPTDEHSAPLALANARSGRETQAALQPSEFSDGALAARNSELSAQITAPAQSKAGSAENDGHPAAVVQDSGGTRAVVTDAALFSSGMQSPSSAAQSSPPARLVLPFSPESSNWQEGFGARLSWLVREGIQVAELRIRPPELGFIEVRIAVSQQEANIAFATQHSAARDAIESALPRLREMLSEGGISLGNVDVSEHSVGRDSHAAFAESKQSDDWQVSPAISDAAAVVERTVIRQGLVDRYA